MDIDNFKSICVVGWARTGISLASLLLSLKKKVIVSEIKERKDFSARLVDNFRRKGVAFEFGGHSRNFIKNAQLVILSPGVDLRKSSLLNIYSSLNIPCIGDVEFSSWLTKAEFIAISGTNGKTTTSFLTYQVLKEGRKRLFLGGNIGIPLSSFVLAAKKGDYIVLEVSSFQLENILQWRPYVASLLNIEPDHFDRYPNFKDYFEAKMNIFKNQKKGDWAVLNANSKILKAAERRVKVKTVYFSSEFPNENFSCVYRIARIFGLGEGECVKVFSRFNGLPHRLQLVRKLNGIFWVNDSKATNPSSTIWALKNIKRRRKDNRKPDIILIAGGKDKGLDYSSITPCLRRVKKINLLGEAAHKIKETLPASACREIFPSLGEAVRKSLQEAGPGDTVLFSPMCSSFDMFSNYRQRGNEFVEIVNKL